MKLLAKSNRLFLIFLSVAYLVTGIVLFIAVRTLINVELDELLEEKTVYIEQYLASLPDLPEAIQVTDELVEVKKIPEHISFEKFSDTTLWNIVDDEPEPYRSYTRSMFIGNSPVVVKVSTSKMESEDLITTMGFLLIILLGLMFLGTYLLTRYLSGRLWQPFHQTLDELKSFDFTSDALIETRHTDIEEFQMLNQALQNMSAKLHKDFLALKSFAENASHEIQTPLSVIKNNIELIIQQNDRSKEEWNRLEEISKAATRISKIQKALLLLTAIENKQYTHIEMINVRQIIQEKLEELDARVQDKKIDVTIFSGETSVPFNPHLMEILINNLLSNAIKHNLPDGKIEVELAPYELVISNTGNANYANGNQIFNRFVKGDPSSSSLGLGLAIVKQICDAYDVSVEYSFDGKLHQVRLRFPMKLVA